MKKRLLSILLTVCLLMGLLPTAALAAEGDVEYLYCDANGANWQTGTITAREYIVVESGITTWAGGWYVVNRDVTIDSRVTVMGNVHLILTDGCTLTVNGGIQVTGGKALGGDSLTIYGQENGTGKLIATGTSYSNTGIGGRFDGNNGSGGTVTIHGGTVEATGKPYAILRIASDRRYKDKDGNKLTDYISIKVRGPLAERCAAFAWKGCKLAAAGDFETITFADDPQRQPGFLIKASDVEFLSPHKVEDAAQTVEDMSASEVAA